MTGRKKSSEKRYGPHRQTAKQLEFARTGISMKGRSAASRNKLYRFRSSAIPAGQDDYILGGHGLPGGHAGFGR